MLRAEGDAPWPSPAVDARRREDCALCAAGDGRAASHVPRRGVSNALCVEPLLNCERLWHANCAGQAKASAKEQRGAKGR